jgi:purine-cytosine permease-like protein
VFTAPFVDLAVALSVPDGDWVLLVSGAVVVFSVFGLAWASSGADVARYQRAGTTGSSAVFVTVLGATLPAVLLISWGAVLAASNATLSDGLQSNPIDLLSSMLPAWYPAPLIAAVALSLLAASSVSLYSAGFAVLAAGVRVPRLIGVTLAVLMTAALVGLLLLTVSDVTVLFRDALTTLAVPVAAWAGIFGAETLLRRHRVHGPSLLSRGGVYPAVRWVNLGMLVVITGVGWGLSTATMVGLQWQGYLFAAVQVDAQSALAASDPGVLIALVFGILTPLILGIPGLRRLQRAERAAAEAGLS